MKAKKTFEEAMARLEEIVGLLEIGTQSLEESLTLFEEGTKLAAYCNTALTGAKLKITELTAGDETDSKEEASDE